MRVQNQKAPFNWTHPNARFYCLRGPPEIFRVAGDDQPVRIKRIRSRLVSARIEEDIGPRRAVFGITARAGVKDLRQRRCLLHYKKEDGQAKSWKKKSRW